MNVRLVCKRTLNGIGVLLTIAAVLSVALRLHDDAGSLDLAALPRQTWALLPLLSLGYGIANVWLALAWWQLLRMLRAHVTASWAVITFGMTQLAKYLPGNVFHLAGRQAIGMAAGLPAWSLARSAFWEIALLVAGGIIFGILAVPGLFPTLRAGWALAGFAGTLAAGFVLLRRCRGTAAGIAFCSQGLFLATAGLVFAGLLQQISTATALLPWATICGAYTIAWLAGLLTPGAPAGAGIREMVLLVLLKDIVEPDPLLLAVVLGRFITVAGDAFFFIGAVLMKRHLRSVAKTSA